MAELNLNQIIEKLNNEFAGEAWKLVFWYDDNGDFVDDIDTVQLNHAKIHRLTPTNQFRTKILLERQDLATNYLIYAPFPKPPVEENHLEDTLLYSKRFYADRASLICVDLGIQEKYKPVIQKYIKYFADKKRTQRFYDLEMENFTKETIEIALMSAICQSKAASFEEVVCILLTEGDLTENKYIIDLLTLIALCSIALGKQTSEAARQRVSVYDDGIDFPPYKTNNNQYAYNRALADVKGEQTTESPTEAVPETPILQSPFMGSPLFCCRVSRLDTDVNEYYLTEDDSVKVGDTITVTSDAGTSDGVVIGIKRLSEMTEDDLPKDDMWILRRGEDDDSENCFDGDS